MWTPILSPRTLCVSRSLQTSNTMTEQELIAKWGADCDPYELSEEDCIAYKNDCFDLYESEGFSDTFHSPYDDEIYKHNGKHFKVLRRATIEECDVETLPIWLVQFEGEEEPYYCYAEEICKSEE